MTRNKPAENYDPIQTRVADFGTSCGPTFDSGTYLCATAMV